MDFLIVFAIVFACAGVAAILSGGVKPWAKGEWRLMRLHTWAPEDAPEPCTMRDPRVQSMVIRQRALGKRLRREGRSLLGRNRKNYVPALTKPEERDEGTNIIAFRGRS